MRRYLSVFFIFLLGSVLLTACSSMNSNFDCPNKVGVMCKNLDQINEMVDKGKIQSQNHTVSNKAITISTPAFQPFTAIENNDSSMPHHTQETVERIWVAPFEDTEENYHQESFIYAIFKRGHWLEQPVKAKNKVAMEEEPPCLKG